MNNGSMGEIRYRSMPTTTLKEIVEVYRRTACKVQVREEGHTVLLREVRHLKWEDFEIFSATYINEAQVSMRHENDAITFLLPSDGQIELSLRSRRTIRTNGAIAVPGARCSKLRLPSGRKQVRLSIPIRRFQKHLTAINGQPAERPLKFDELPKLDQHMVDGLIDLIEALLDDADSALSGPLLAHRIEMIEIGLLAIWPNSLWQKKADISGYAVPRYVRSAMRIIRDNPFSALSIPDLASACNISVRSLQKGFRQFTSYSVSEFVTHMRIKIVRSRLDDADFINEVRIKLGRHAFNKLNREYKIEYGINI